MGFGDFLKLTLDTLRSFSSSGQGKLLNEEPFHFLDEVVSESRKQEILKENFHGSLQVFPTNMTEVYYIFGRAPKDTSHLQYPKANMTIAENLPGDWNNGKTRLYMLAYMEDYTREALRRCEQLGVIDSIYSVGCYNHRHQRYDTSRPLSLHSWGAALDINHDSNKAAYRKNGVPFPPPFSAGWLDLYPNGMSVDVILAFKSVGFAWGGDWGYDNWEEFVKKFGVGYDLSVLSRTDLNLDDWKKVNYRDPTHFELIRR